MTCEFPSSLFLSLFIAQSCFDLDCKLISAYVNATSICDSNKFYYTQTYLQTVA